MTKSRDKAPKEPKAPRAPKPSKPPKAAKAGKPPKGPKEPKAAKPPKELKEPKESKAPKEPKLKQPRSLHETDRRVHLRFPPGPRVQQWMVVVLLVTAFVSLVVKGANGPADPYFRTERRVPIAGFGEIAYRVSATAQGTRCALLAQTAQQQAKGLAGQRDLAGYDGLLFAFPADTSTAFFMKDVPVPLSIAWFDTGGRLIGTADLEPCLDRPDCPAYTAPRAFRYALQVPKGGLGGLGIGTGSVISVGGPCE